MVIKRDFQQWAHNSDTHIHTHWTSNCRHPPCSCPTCIGRERRPQCDACNWFRMPFLSSSAAFKRWRLATTVEIWLMFRALHAIDYIRTITYLFDSLLISKMRQISITSDHTIRIDTHRAKYYTCIWMTVQRSRQLNMGTTVDTTHLAASDSVWLQRLLDAMPQWAAMNESQAITRAH